MSEQAPLQINTHQLQIFVAEKSIFVKSGKPAVDIPCVIAAGDK